MPTSTPSWHPAARRAAPRGAAARYAQREGVEEVKVIGLRRKIAEKMQDAKRRIPHFAYVEEVDVTELEALRAHLNATKRAGSAEADHAAVPDARPGARSCRDYPQINATLRRRGRRRAPPRRGPYRHRHPDAERPDRAGGAPCRGARRLGQRGRDRARLAARPRDGKAAREELSGSTITITSLGALGGIATTPVINHPEVAIIGPNKIVERPVVRDGQIVVRKMMNLSSSFDHRVVDGYDAAEFIQRIKGLLEHPATLFMD